MRKETSFNFARYSTGAKPCGANVTAERTRIVNERDTICTTESERVVPFDAITLGAAFHSSKLAEFKRSKRAIEALRSKHKVLSTKF